MGVSRRAVLGGAAALALVASGLAAGGPAEAAKDRKQPLRADRVLVIKHKRQLHLMWKGGIVKTYRIALGDAPKGHKEREGDSRTPEGVYTIDRHFPKSSFHKALHIDYPNEDDRRRAEEKGVDPGGQIEIHGLGASMKWAGRRHADWDWTAGCIAVTDAEIEEIYAAVPDGTPIEIRP